MRQLHIKIVWELVVKDLRGRYAGSLGGLLWIVLHPLFLIAIFSIVFSELMFVRAGELGSLSYVVYLCAGLLPWVCIENSLKDSSLCFISNANLIKKMHFPRSALVLQVVISQHLLFLAALVVYLIFLVVIGHNPLFLIMYFFPVVFMQLLLVTGLALILAPIAVYLRDMIEWVGIILRFLFWLTPIVYLEDTLSPQISAALCWNPAIYLIRLNHDLFFMREIPEMKDLLVFSGYAGFFFLLGIILFNKLGRDLVDQL